MFNLDSRKTPARGLINAMMQVLYIEGSDTAISIQHIEVEAQVATTYTGLNLWACQDEKAQFPQAAQR